MHTPIKEPVSDWPVSAWPDSTRPDSARLGEKVFSIVDIIHGDINVQRYFENIGIISR